jgi:hypothetical protein
VGTPKIWGLLSWYDESPSWLAEAVASFAPMLDGLIAVDGAYALYPDARTSYVDWLWVFDADCVLTEYPADMRDRLAETDADAVEVSLWERHDYQQDAPDIARAISLPPSSASPMRMLFRCLDRMQVIGAHYIYAGVREDGEYCYLWGPPHVAPVDGVLFTDVTVEHRSSWRDLYRREAARDYYKRREVAGIERLTTEDEGGRIVKAAR